MIFSHIPAFAISGTVIRLLAKITVLGPVPAGMINTNEQAKVAGIIRSIGFILPATAMLASIGRKILAVAVLEFISVKSNTAPTTIISTIRVGKLLTKAS